MPDAKRVFEDILESIHRNPLVIFDLDSTLYNVSHRTQKILENFMREPDFAKAFPKEIDLIRKVKVEHRDWGLKEAFQRTNIAGSPEFVEAIKNYWRTHFFSSKYLKEDIPYAGAVEYVNELARAGARIYYLTGRDAEHMLEGTLESLSQWGFPMTNIEETLIMKPYKGSHEDEEFKDVRIRELLEKERQRSNHPLVWFFENEPLIIHQIRKSHPAVKVVWIDTTHSRKAPPPEGLYIVRDKWQTR